MKTETYVCQSCGIDVVRPVVRGQRPKWCEECRRRGRGSAPCLVCGQATWKGAKGYCSTTCAQSVRRVEGRPTLTPEECKALWLEQRSPLRKAIEDDLGPDAVLAAVKDRAAMDAAGCWVWPQINRSGYPVTRMGKRNLLIHRLVLEAKHRAPLGTQAAHHACANTHCVNPDHLQPVTHRENVAEMLARQSYLARIRELEEALASIDPSHPTLLRVSVA